jgi:hypothetical protein
MSETWRGLGVITTITRSGPGTAASSKVAFGSRLSTAAVEVVELVTLEVEPAGS